MTSAPLRILLLPAQNADRLEPIRTRVRSLEPAVRVKARLFDHPPEGWPQVPPPCSTKLMLEMQDGERMAVQDDDTYAALQVPPDAMVYLAFEPGTRVELQTTKGELGLSIWGEETVRNVLTRAVKRMSEIDALEAVELIENSWEISRNAHILNLDALVSECGLKAGDVITTVLGQGIGAEDIAPGEPGEPEEVPQEPTAAGAEEQF